MDLSISLAKTKKAKPEGKLTFGSVFTDHMLTMEYSPEKGWHDAKIQPYASFHFDPATIVLHYGQSIFEGLKAYRTKAGEVQLFRPRLNFERLNSSAERMCMPPVDVDFALDALKKLLEIDKDWIPTEEGTSLYIRPTMIATDVSLSVHASKKYLFYIILNPVGAYYENGFAPVSLKVESKYVRAVKGGTGHYKFSGNYASSLLAGEIAEREGFDQVMWLDAAEHKYVEEVGSMNIFFVLNGTVVTPMLGGSILPGITRKSVLELLTHWGLPVEERLVSMKEILDGAASGALSESFGTGTAAVISPVGKFSSGGVDYTVGKGVTGEITMRLYNTLTEIQDGRLPDLLNWIEKL